jgi:hypothetical protein
MLIHCPHCELEAKVDASDPANLQVNNEAALYARCLHIKEISASGKAPPSRLLAACPILSRAVQSASQRSLSPAKETESLFVVLACKRGTGKFAEYPAVDVMERIHAALDPLGAVVGVPNGGGTATIRVPPDSADEVLAAVATIPGVLSAELVKADATAAASRAGNRDTVTVHSIHLHPSS